VWLVLAILILLTLTACGGSSSNSPTAAKQNPETGSYKIQVQGTTAAQPNPVSITTVGLTVQ
jgi:type 1 fimbria pilin